MSAVSRSLAFLFALSMMAMGGVAFLVHAHGILDPVGLKMADDGDPFGTPPTQISLIVGCLLSGAVFCAGAWVMSRISIPSRPPQRQVSLGKP